MKLTRGYQTIAIDYSDSSLITITLNRPEVRNAINSVMMKELYQFWREINQEASNEIKCIILTGAGDKAFCAGADLKERLNLSTNVWKQQHKLLQLAIRAMIDCPIPIIAAINGAAFGGGLELALASDFIYAAQDASFSQSEVKLGLMPGAMGSQNLAKACGIRRAKELTFTGEAFTAKQAFEWGIVNQLCDKEQLLANVKMSAAKIILNAPIAIKNVKKAINASLFLDLQTGYSYELALYNELLSTADREEGIKAFNEKRQADFRGE